MDNIIARWYPLFVKGLFGVGVPMLLFSLYAIISQGEEGVSLIMTMFCMIAPLLLFYFGTYEPLSKNPSEVFPYKGALLLIILFIISKDAAVVFSTRSYTKVLDPQESVNVMFLSEPGTKYLVDQFYANLQNFWSISLAVFLVGVVSMLLLIRKIRQGGGHFGRLCSLTGLFLTCC